MRPPRPISFDNPSAIVTDVYHATDPQTLELQLPLRIKALQKRVNKRLDSAQDRYELGYDRKFVLRHLSLAK